jgi:hypothetical protein
MIDSVVLVTFELQAKGMALAPASERSLMPGARRYGPFGGELSRECMKAL